MSERILEGLKAHLSQHNWRFTQIRQTALLVPVPGKNGQLLGLFQAREEQEQFTFEVSYTFQAPERRRLAVAELLARLNYPLVVGAFQMDLADGEVGYKAGLDVTGTPLTPALIQSMMTLGLATADAHLPAIAAVCFAGVSAAAAAELLEEGETDFTIEQAIAMAAEMLEADD